MSHLRFGAALAGFCVLLASAQSRAQVPHHLNHQGILTTDAGVIVPDGEYVLEFEIHDTPSASTTPLFEQQLTVNVVKGLYNVLLSDNPGGSLTDAFNGATRYLQIRIVTSPGGTYDNLTLSPRQQIASVPYALVAGRVVEEVAPPPAIETLACRDTDNSTTQNRYTEAWADALVSCSVTVPGEGYVILVRGAVFADNQHGAIWPSLVGRIRENCGGSVSTVASGNIYVSNDNDSGVTDLAYVPLSYTRTVTQPAQTCTYTLEARSSSNDATFAMNVGDEANNLAPNAPDIVTWIEAVALPTR